MGMGESCNSFAKLVEKIIEMTKEKKIVWQIVPVCSPPTLVADVEINDVRLSIVLIYEVHGIWLNSMNYGVTIWRKGGRSRDSCRAFINDACIDTRHFDFEPLYKVIIGQGESLGSEMEKFQKGEEAEQRFRIQEAEKFAAFVLDNSTGK